ncbi:carnosine synthase 1-like isoform X1 [Dreissena polymorpha]|uniref:carnosine synthase 1-like isoform X1 n=1 Tax=Dreissena polymorpha TaxID=45954 RepID=UPI002264876F|nr:carnosine synthase 1-like isoform X1 [Dreissena polymorpha]XP_052224634.1 carnosine synthase 1-like isoform X1 [Dreissena polymorpha]
MADSTSYQENIHQHEKNADYIEIHSLAKQVEDMDTKEKYEKEVDKDKDIDNDKDVDDNEKEVNENVKNISTTEKNDKTNQEVERIDGFEVNCIPLYGVEKTADQEASQNCKTGMRVMWNTEVNVGDPAILGNGYQVDNAIEVFYNTLQYILYVTGFPETEDRSAMPRLAINKEKVVVGVLSPAEDCMALLLECGNQVPDSMHLILKESWVLKKPHKEKPGQFELFILKAITCHKGGVTYLDEFNPPRKCTYLINYFFGCGEPAWGNEMEKNLDIPISSPIPLCNQVDDKVWMRYKMSRCGVAHPETLAFRLAPQRFVPSIDTIRVFEVDRCMKRKKSQTGNSMQNDSRGNNSNMQNTSNGPVESHPTGTFTAKHIENGGVVCTHAAMELEIRNFLNKPSILNRKIVVKPAGPSHYGSIGVTFHDPGSIKSVIDAVEDLLDKIIDGESILVETFVEPINPRPVRGISDNIKRSKGDSGLTCRVRATACKDFDGKPVCSIITCGVASKHAPVHGDNTVPQTLDTTLQTFGISDPSVRRNIEQDVRKRTEDTLQTIIDEEKKMTAEQRGGIGGYTEIIGIDFFLTEKNGHIFPVAVEVNSHDCTVNCHMLECLADMVHQCTILNGRVLSSVYQPSEKISGVCSDKSSQYERRDCVMPKVEEIFGQCVRPWVRTMLTRSQDYLLQDKMILVIGAGGYSNKFILPSALEMGVKVVLVESNPMHFAGNLVHRFICIDIENHKQDHSNASIIVETLGEENISVDGCLTFWEDCGPLAALVSELLQLKGNTYKAAYMAKMKSSTQAFLRGNPRSFPHLPFMFMFACKSACITCEADIPKAIKCVSFPALLKLDYASCAVGTKMVKCEDDVFNQYGYITNTLRINNDYHGIGLGFSNSMVLMEHLQGTDHTIDVVMFEMKLVAALITDISPTNLPSYMETSAMMPSALNVDKQAQMVSAAFQCLSEIGLSNGVFNVQMKMTHTGPKLIDINARTGSLYIRDWVKRLYHIDLMKCALMVSCGVRPYIRLLPPSEYIMGVMLIPSLHKHVILDNVIRMVLEGMQSRGEVIFTMLESEEDLLHQCDKTDYEQPYANIAVRAPTIDEARKKAHAVCKKLGIETSSYKVSEFIKLF